MPDDINYPSKRIFGAIKRGSINAGVINGVAFNIDSDGLRLHTVKGQWAKGFRCGSASGGRF